MFQEGNSLLQLKLFCCTGKSPGISNTSVAIALLSSFLFGYSVCVLNSCEQLVAVTLEWCGNNWQSECLASRASQGLMNASAYLGAAAGALLIGRQPLSTRGSRLQLCLADVFFASGAIVCAMSYGLHLLVLGRFLTGLGLGIAAIAAPLYIAEMSSEDCRGSNTGLHGVFISVGILASIAFGLPQGPPPSGPSESLDWFDKIFWRGLMAFQMVPALLQFILFYWTFPVDPPALLAAQGRMRDASQLLCQIYRSKTLEPHLRATLETSAAACAARPIRMTQAFWDPFLRPAVILGVGLSMLQQLCGSNPMMAYSNNLFFQSGVPPQLLTLTSAGMATVNLGVSVFSSRLVDILGRRILLLTGTGTQAASLIVLAVYLALHASVPNHPAALPFIPVTCVCTFVMSFSFGLGAVTWIYLSEIYPAEVRSSALSACGIINWLTCFAVVLGARLLNLEKACQLFGVVCAFGALFIYVLVLETKGCPIGDNPVTPRTARSSSTTLWTPDADYHQLKDDKGDDTPDNSTIASSPGSACPKSSAVARFSCLLQLFGQSPKTKQTLQSPLFDDQKFADSEDGEDMQDDSTDASVASSSDNTGSAV